MTRQTELPWNGASGNITFIINRNKLGEPGCPPVSPGIPPVEKLTDPQLIPNLLEIRFVTRNSSSPIWVGCKICIGIGIRNCEGSVVGSKHLHCSFHPGIVMLLSGAIHGANSTLDCFCLQKFNFSIVHEHV